VLFEKNNKSVFSSLNKQFIVDSHMDKTQLFEKPPLIVEIGSLFTKIGTSDENMPQKIIYTPQALRKWLLSKESSHQTV